MPRLKSPLKPLQLPRVFRPTHQTSGLDGFPAVDVFAPSATTVLAPATGKVVKLSGHPPTPRATPGGPYGWSVYLERKWDWRQPGFRLRKGGVYYLTHLGTRTVELGQQVKRGQPIGTVASYKEATNGVTPSHVHEGYHDGPIEL